jgi:UDP-3-O-[3-hydroxymyristoyl] glucosamine N-acyltransferase
VTVGRHCLLAAQIGLAGSLTIGDNVALARDNAADLKGEGQE